MALKALLTEAFADKLLGVATADAWASVLRMTTEVREIKRAIKAGGVTEAVLRAFVNRLFSDFRRGQRFEHEPALAAMAVALETHPTTFAGEYLRSLANLKIAEVPLASRVARICERKQQALPKNKSREFRITVLPEAVEPHVVHAPYKVPAENTPRDFNVAA